MSEQAIDGGLRQRILQAATRLFASRGFSGTSMRELTESCQCTKPALYYYFAGKEALFREVVEHHNGRMVAIVAQTIEGEGPVRERLHEGLEALLEYCEAEPAAMRLMQRIETSPEENAPEIAGCVSRQLHLQFISELLEVGVSADEVRANVPIHEAALLLCGAIHFQFETAIASGEWNRQQMHRTIDLVFDGIAADQPQELEA